jgi:hypothetical protein
MAAPHVVLKRRSASLRERETEAEAGPSFLVHHERDARRESGSPPSAAGQTRRLRKQARLKAMPCMETREGERSCEQTQGSLQGIEARSVYISCNCLCILRGLACVSTTHRHALHREREEEGYLTQCQLWPCLGFLSARLGRSALRLYSAPCNHAACACIYGSFSLAWRSVQCACAFFFCPCRVMSYVDRRDRNRICAWDERAVISG